MRRRVQIAALAVVVLAGGAVVYLLKPRPIRSNVELFDSEEVKAALAKKEAENAKRHTATLLFESNEAHTEEHVKTLEARWSGDEKELQQAAAEGSKTAKAELMQRQRIRDIHARRTAAKVSDCLPALQERLRAFPHWKVDLKVEGERLAVTGHALNAAEWRNLETLIATQGEVILVPAPPLEMDEPQESLVRIMVRRVDPYEQDRITLFPDYVYGDRGMLQLSIQSTEPQALKDGEYRVLLQLNPISGEALYTLTKNNLNNRLAVLVDGVAFSMPTLMASIPDGAIGLLGSFGALEAEVYAAILRGAPMPVGMKLVEEGEDALPE
ncbi:MAG: hypothetical protein M5U26_13360 [Planctomycetota bacterium]|nr:hypothetical protein [Planctomycetota bacterium]